jgi:hypothetical protein
MTKAKSKTKVATRSAAQKMRKGKSRARSVLASSKSTVRPDTKHARIIGIATGAVVFGVRTGALSVDPGRRIHRDAGRRCAPAFATSNRRGVACRRRAGGQGRFTMAVDHRTGDRRGRLSPDAADRICHKLLAWGVSRDGRDCFGNGLCGRPAHDSGTDVRRQSPHRSSIRPEQRSSACWRAGRDSPYRASDSVIRTCLAFRFWCRRGDWRSHLRGSSGERCYIDRPGGESPPSVKR